MLSPLCYLRLILRACVLLLGLYNVLPHAQELPSTGWQLHYGQQANQPHSFICITRIPMCCKLACRYTELHTGQRPEIGGARTGCKRRMQTTLLPLHVNSSHRPRSGSFICWGPAVCGVRADCTKSECREPCRFSYRYPPATPQRRTQSPLMTYQTLCGKLPRLCMLSHCRLPIGNCQQTGDL